MSIYSDELFCHVNAGENFPKMSTHIPNPTTTTKTTSPVPVYSNEFMRQIRYSEYEKTSIHSYSTQAWTSYKINAAIVKNGRHLPNLSFSLAVHVCKHVCVCVLYVCMRSISTCRMHPHHHFRMCRIRHCCMLLPCMLCTSFACCTMPLERYARSWSHRMLSSRTRSAINEN